VISRKEGLARLTVNLESHLDLGNSSWGRWDIRQVKLAEQVVVLGHRSLPLEYLNSDRGLVVDGGGEDLRFLGRDDGVSANELGHDSTGRLDTHSQGADIDQEDTGRALLARKDTTLDGGTVRDSLVRVDSLGGLLAVEVLLEELLDLGNSGGSTDQDNLVVRWCILRHRTERFSTHVVNLLLLDTGVLENLLDGLHGLSEKIHVELLKLGSGQGLHESAPCHGRQSSR
jgi:hypothetical protein